jgi:uncharacterized protein
LLLHYGAGVLVKSWSALSRSGRLKGYATMRWEDFRRSTNIRDRRGAAAGGLGIGTVVVLGLLGWALGIDPRLLIGGAETISSRAPIERDASPTGPPRDNQGRFAAAILGNTEDVWKDVLPAQTGVAYKPPLMELFSGSTRTRCGAGAAAMGPFYCPLDQTIYLDLTFFREMEQKFRAGGEFAYAYVIAHEVGHHVENLMGILGRVCCDPLVFVQMRLSKCEAHAELPAHPVPECRPSSIGAGVHG